MDTPRRTRSVREILAPALAGLRHHWLSFLFIQGAALAILIGYWSSPAVRESLGHLIDLKNRSGLLFSAVAGSCAGGIFPEFAKLCTGRLRKFDRTWLTESAFNAFVYGVIGVQVDLFYRFQTVLFGPHNDLGTLAIKTLVDQFLFSPILCVPTAMVLYDLRTPKIRPFKIGARAFYLDHVLPMMVPCWGFWIPILFCVYAMPTDLQYSLSVLAEAAWSILFVFMTMESSTGPDSQVT